MGCDTFLFTVVVKSGDSSNCSLLASSEWSVRSFFLIVSRSLFPPETLAEAFNFDLYDCVSHSRVTFSPRASVSDVNWSSWLLFYVCLRSTPVTASLCFQLSDTPKQDRCHNLLNALNSHKDRWDPVQSKPHITAAGSRTLSNKPAILGMFSNVIYTPDTPHLRPECFNSL